MRLEKKDTLQICKQCVCFFFPREVPSGLIPEAYRHNWYRVLELTGNNFDEWNKLLKYISYTSFEFLIDFTNVKVINYEKEVRKPIWQPHRKTLLVFDRKCMWNTDLKMVFSENSENLSWLRKCTSCIQRNLFLFRHD